MAAETGEPHAVLNVGRRESAVALMAGVDQNHPFQQGRKRAAFEAGLNFLGAKGVTLDEAVDSAPLADDFVLLIEHKASEHDFAERLRPYVRPLD